MNSMQASSTGLRRVASLPILAADVVCFDDIDRLVRDGGLDRVRERVAKNCAARMSRFDQAIG
jgi:hypothetical protein